MKILHIKLFYFEKNSRYEIIDFIIVLQINSSQHRLMMASQFSDVQLRMLHIQHSANKEQEYFKTFRKLKESEVFTDVTFVAQNGRSLCVHRLVLASYSQLLKEMMEADKIIEGGGVKIILPDVEYTDVEALCHILYGVEVSVPRTRFNKIYNLAHMLGIPVSKLNNPEHFLLHHQHPKDQLNTRTKEKKKNAPPLCCWYCYSTFPTLALFQRHLEEAHPNETLQKVSVKPSHKCPKCQKTFLTMYKLRQHLLTHPTPKRVSKRGDHEYAEEVPEEQASKSSLNQKKSVSDHPYANPVELESTPAPAQKVEAEHPEVVQARVDRVSSDHSYGTRQRLASIRESDHAYSTQISDDHVELVQVLPVPVNVRTSQPPPGSEVIAQVSQIESDHPLPPKGAAKRKASLKTRKVFEPVVANKITKTSSPRIIPNKYNCEICGRTFDVPYKKKRHVQEVHNKVKKHACQFCDKAFFKVSSRKRHE